MQVSKQTTDPGNVAETSSRSVAGSLSIEHELRLRRWAREYYVEPSQRCDAWHPVILQEMELKDYEDAAVVDVATTRYVPLEPTIERRIDQAHEARGPYFSKPVVRHRLKDRLFADIVPGEMYYT